MQPELPPRPATLRFCPRRLTLTSDRQDEAYQVVIPSERERKNLFQVPEPSALLLIIFRALGIANPAIGSDFSPFNNQSNSQYEHDLPVSLTNRVSLSKCVLFIRADLPPT